MKPVYITGTEENFLSEIKANKIFYVCEGILLPENPMLLGKHYFDMTGSGGMQPDILATITLADGRMSKTDQENYDELTAKLADAGYKLVFKADN